MIKMGWPIARNEKGVLLNVFVERYVDADGCGVLVVGRALQVFCTVNKMCISHFTYLPCVVLFSIHMCIQSLPFVVWVKKAWFRAAGAVDKKD